MMFRAMAPHALFEMARRGGKKTHAPKRLKFRTSRPLLYIAKKPFSDEMRWGPEKLSKEASRSANVTNREETQ